MQRVSLPSDVRGCGLPNRTLTEEGTGLRQLSNIFHRKPYLMPEWVRSKGSSH